MSRKSPEALEIATERRAADRVRTVSRSAARNAIAQDRGINSRAYARTIVRGI